MVISAILWSDKLLDKHYRVRGYPQMMWWRWHKGRIKTFIRRYPWPNDILDPDFQTRFFSDEYQEFVKIHFNDALVIYKV